MAQPSTVQVKVELDVADARAKVRKVMTAARDALTALARLDEALAQIEGREAALAHYGIKLIEERKA